MQPIVSILLPAHDAEASLEACLRSIARQTERRWECLVIDDGSTDHTAEIAGEFARRDGRFRLISTAHRGIVEALNTGVAEARAAWIARMDADDLMHRQRIEAQLQHASGRPNLVALGCHVRIFPRADMGQGMRSYERWINSIRSPSDVRREATVECPIAHPTLMIRSEALRRHAYRNVDWPEDYDLMLRLVRANAELDVVPRRLLAWRNGRMRLSRTDPRYSLERFVECKADHLARSFLARDDEYVLWGYGQTGRSLRRALSRHGRNPNLIVELHPGRLGQKIHGATVIPPEALEAHHPQPIVVSVAGQGPRSEIRRALTSMGFREQDAFVCAA